MSRFSVKAIRPDGEIRAFSREAANERELALALLGEGMTPVSITEQNGGVVDLLNRPLALGQKTRIRDTALFCEQIGAMTGSGLTIEQALRVSSRQAAKRPTARTARRLLPRIQSGMPLSAALESEPGLPRYLPAMIRAAESGGRLAEGLVAAGRYLQRQAETRSALVNALTYPVIVLVTVVAALMLVLTVVIPGFEPVFAGEEHRLPALTRVVLWLSELAVHHAAGALTGLATILIAGFVVQYRVPRLRDRFDRIAARLRPVQLVRQLNVARVLSVLGMLFQSGVDAAEAVVLAANAAGSGRLRAALEDAARKLREGASITTALEAVDAIPEETRALVEVGEHTGELGSMTLRAAQLLETDTSLQIERLVALANPLAIACLGVVVGLVVSGVMLGILSINQLALKS